MKDKKRNVMKNQLLLITVVQVSEQTSTETDREKEFLQSALGSVGSV